MLVSQVCLEDLAYLLILELFVLGVIMTVDLIRYKARVKQVEDLLKRPVAEQSYNVEAKDILEERYVDLIHAQEKSRVDTENMSAKSSKDMEQYYNIWVHQIKTPISGMNVLLQSMEPTEEVGELQNQLFSVEQYVDMALQYQKIKSTTNDFSFAEIPLNKVIRENIRKYARLFIAKKLAVRYEETALRVLTDEKWISFVLGQIITNAVKYSDKGSITISACEDERNTYLSVKDEGIGISPEDLPRVFERGYTGYNGRADKKSTGIGLFLCKSVTRMLGHKIQISSEPGKGTEVTIIFSKQRITE
ncbi:MAG: sensor histidine kinase [Lachnobacterium sp.]|nr:sensor histidine kinase [Lachnobacterium sp.]